MKNKLITVFWTFLIIMTFAGKIDFVNAEYTTRAVYFSNLSETYANEYRPGIYSGKNFTVTGILINNVVYVRLIDFQKALGVSYSFQNLGSTTKLTLSGNSSPQVFFYNNSNTYGITQTYSVATRLYEIYRQGHIMTNGVVTQSTYKSYFYQSSNGYPYIYYNGYYYLPAKIASLSLGSLVYFAHLHYDAIYDYRVNSAYSSYSDGNTYLTGGKWLNNWSTEGTDYLAPHFPMNEIWSKSTNDPFYLYQIKVSVTQLSAAELVRHYYRNDLSLGIDPGFRGWNQNYNMIEDGAAPLSWHTRGRAWDSDNVPEAIRVAVQADMAINDNGDDVWPSPAPPKGSIFRSVKSNYQEISLGKEIEVGMEWLHLQTDANPAATTHALLP